MGLVGKICKNLDFRQIIEKKKLKVPDNFFFFFNIIEFIDKVLF